MKFLFIEVLSRFFRTNSTDIQLRPQIFFLDFCFLSISRDRKIKTCFNYFISTLLNIFLFLYIYSNTEKRYYYKMLMYPRPLFIYFVFVFPFVCFFPSFRFGACHPMNAHPKNSPRIHKIHCTPLNKSLKYPKGNILQKSRQLKNAHGTLADQESRISK